MSRTPVSVLAGALALVAGLSFATARCAPMIPAYIAAAAANPARPATDSELDADRKPAETLAFTGVKPGYTVVDFFPGGGYFSRLFSGVLGAKGKVYAFVPAELGPMMKKPLPVSGSVPDPAWPNIIALVGPVNQFATPEPVDIVFTAQNYHDLHDPFMAPADLKLFNAAVFKALKKGGLYVVLDHSAPDGSGLASTNTTHRIDADVVKAEVTAAGFRFVRAGEFLRNPADPRTALVFDKSIRHHTDQFVFLFRKP